MDKSRDVRRLLSRCSGHNRINSEKKLVISELSGSGGVFAAKYRGEKLRRLSLVGRSGGGGGCEDDQDTEMGSDGQYESPSVVSAKKLKPHKKIFEDSIAVNRSSIPRKLRSVIKKRTCPTISQPQPNPKNHVNGLQTSETTRRDCLKKPKCGMFHPEQMSKDEEEVAETLYALAWTAARKGTSLANKSDGESPSERRMHSKKLDDSLPSSLGLQSPEDSAEETSNQTSEELSKQKMDVGDMGNSTPFSQPKLSQTILQRNLNQSVAKTSSWAKKNNFEQREALLSKGVPGNNYVIPQTGDPANQDKHWKASTESKKNGSTLLPSLYSQALHGSGGADGFPSQYSAAKLPYWLNTVAASSEPDFHEPQVPHKNESQVENCNRRIKNSCVTHVYICRFIQLSQKAEGKDISLLETRQLKPSEGIMLGVLKASSHLNPASNGSTPMVPDSLICSSFPEKNILGASNDTIMMPGKSVYGQEQASLMAPGNSTLRKQCFDFLSLSTGGSGTEPKVEANRNGIQLNPLAGLPVPQLQPMTRYDSVASLPLPPNLIPFNAYQNLLSTSAQPLPPMPQVHLQLPSYFSRSNQLDGSVKQPQLQPQPPQQHPIWMTQLAAAQYRAGTMAPSQIAQWQSSRQEPYIVQYKQPQTAPSLPSLAPGASHFPNYLQMPQQHPQNQMLSISAPFPPIQANIQHSPVPIYCDKTES